MMHRSVKVIQHVTCETLGTIAPVLERADIACEYIRPYAGETVPKSLMNADGLIIMGGPMSVGEEKNYPYLLDEMYLIEKTIDEHKPVLGVCLGSQLIASVLGAKIGKGLNKEIGWHKVALTNFSVTDLLLSGIPRIFQAFHWHSDIFELPHPATPLAFSESTANQAFRYGRDVYGILFHLEVTQRQVKKMVATFKNELSEAGLNGSKILAETDDHITMLKKISNSVFQRWTSLVTKS